MKKTEHTKRYLGILKFLLTKSYSASLEFAWPWMPILAIHPRQFGFGILYDGDWCTRTCVLEYRHYHLPWIGFWLQQQWYGQRQNAKLDFGWKQQQEQQQQP